MEEPEQAPLSIAGLVNFGNTCFANALLQALASCPAIVQYVDMLFQTLAWSKVVVPYGSGGIGTPLIQALSNALIRLQPHTGFPDLAGTASSLAVLHAMIAHKQPAFQQMGAQQDVCEALQSILLALRTEVNTFLQLQRRPMSFSSRLYCRIPRLLDFPDWNPALDVPVIRNTAQRLSGLTPDDMGELQKHLNKEQGPCSGLLVDCLTCSCGQRFSTKYTDFSTLILPIPSFTDSSGELRVQLGTRLEDCLRLYCEKQEVGPVACPKCSLQTTVENAIEQLQGTSFEQTCRSAGQGLCPKKANWCQRLLQWLGLKQTPPEAVEMPPSRPCSRSSAVSSTQSRGLVELLDDDTELLSSGWSQTYVCSCTGSRMSTSAWSFLENEPGRNEQINSVGFPSYPEATMNDSYLNPCLSPTSALNDQYGSTPTTNPSWSGILDTYHIDSKGLCDRSTTFQHGAVRWLHTSFNLKDFENESKTKPFENGAVVGGGVINRALDVLRSEWVLHDSTIRTLREQLEEANIPWQEKKSMAFAKTMVGRLPEVLPIFFHRKTFMEGAFDKVHGGFIFPKILDMSEFVYMPSIKGSIYHLMAVVIHTGDVSGGHYLTARRVLVSEAESVWFLASDEHIQQVAEEDVMNLEPCMLLYERENLL